MPNKRKLHPTTTKVLGGLGPPPQQHVPGALAELTQLQSAPRDPPDPTAIRPTLRWNAAPCRRNPGRAAAKRRPGRGETPEFSGVPPCSRAKRREITAFRRNFTAFRRKVSGGTPKLIAPIAMAAPGRPETVSGPARTILGWKYSSGKRKRTEALDDVAVEAIVVKGS